MLFVTHALCRFLPALIDALSSEFSVRHPGGSGRLGTQPLDLILLVVTEIAFEPEPLALGHVPFPRQNVGAGAVEEPPVVGDHHGAAREVLQRVFQGGQGFHVQVVGGLVQQDQVAALLARVFVGRRP